MCFLVNILEQIEKKQANYSPSMLWINVFIRFMQEYFVRVIALFGRSGDLKQHFLR